ncbi:MAG: capsule assembly Wzi family protein [Bacteroidota bacterium]
MKKLFVLLIPVLLSAQSVYLPPGHPVYRYLDKMEAKQVITGYRDEVKPLSRERIAGFIIQIDTTMSILTEVEMEEQLFYREEFYEELVNLGYENVIEERWHPYQYKSDIGNFNFNLIGGYTKHIRADGKNTVVISNGASVYGYAGKHVGASFYFRDNRESGSYLDPKRVLSPIPAEVPSRNMIPRSFEYSFIEAQVNVDLGFVSLSVEKMPNVWGGGERGSVILSNRAPSYPQIKLRARLGDNIDFTYIHAWLFSDLIDSLRSYQNPGVPGWLGFRRVYKPKYLAAHMVEFSPWDGVDIAIGESEVYGSRNPEPMYLIPIMFFKAAEHWMTDTDNSQMFFSVDLNVIDNTNLYATMFIDEFSTEDFYLSSRQRNQLGFTVGGRIYDLFLPDTKIMAEYTRLNPWVYNHRFSDATFQSHSVDMGHWLGQNADLFFTQISHQPLRELHVGIQFESWRKGGMLPTQFQYNLPTPTFLYGPVIKSQTYGITGRYEAARDLVIDAQVLRSRYTSEVNSGTGDYSGEWDVFLGIRYGIY